MDKYIHIFNGSHEVRFTISLCMLSLFINYSQVRWDIGYIVHSTVVNSQLAIST